MPTYENLMIQKLLTGINKDSRILEVGCGYCQKTEFLNSVGYRNIVGVEKNEELVKKSREKSFEVYTIEEFESQFADQKFDVLFLSHIIEHFQYNDLKEFLEHYFSFLKDDGYLLVATPVMNENFYDDFDHVKSYSHVGLLSVFGERESQIQFYGSTGLRLINLYYIRNAFELKNYRALALRTPLYRFPRICNQLLHLVYRLSFRIIGRSIAWVGLFSKIPSND
jgi:SAM-dependent methyltransferase